MDSSSVIMLMSGLLSICWRILCRIHQDCLSVCADPYQANFAWSGQENGVIVQLDVVKLCHIKGVAKHDFCDPSNLLKNLKFTGCWCLTGTGGADLRIVQSTNNKLHTCTVSSLGAYSVVGEVCEFYMGVVFMFKKWPMMKKWLRMEKWSMIEKVGSVYMGVVLMIQRWSNKGWTRLNACYSHAMCVSRVGSKAVRAISLTFSHILLILGWHIYLATLRTDSLLSSMVSAQFVLFCPFCDGKLYSILFILIHIKPHPFIFSVINVKYIHWLATNTARERDKWELVKYKSALVPHSLIRRGGIWHICTLATEEKHSLTNCRIM